MPVPCVMNSGWMKSSGPIAVSRTRPRTAALPRSRRVRRKSGSAAPSGSFRSSRITRHSFLHAPSSAVSASGRLSASILPERGNRVGHRGRVWTLADRGDQQPRLSRRLSGNRTRADDRNRVQADAVRSAKQCDEMPHARRRSERDQVDLAPPHPVQHPLVDVRLGQRPIGVDRHDTSNPAARSSFGRTSRPIADRG